jgi:LPXTG-site transpeptidase (sortase) family protein
MKTTIPLRKIFLTLTIAVLLFFVGFIFYFVFFQSGINSGLGQLTSSAVAFLDKEQAGTSFPIRLRVPSINLDVAIEYVGIAPNGTLGVPAGPVNAGWFDRGPVPGEIGTAVIDGHSGWRDGISAAFDNLSKLKKGDKVYVENKKGIVTTFIVRKFGTYNPKANASDLFISSDGKAHLNLVTCAGTWNAVEKTHSKRLVVFTDLVVN